MKALTHNATDLRPTGGARAASIAARLAVVGVLAIAGPYAKLTAQDAPVALFEEIGLGRLGMYATGVAELIAIVLILIPRTVWLGASIAAGAMGGALGGHLFLGLGVSISPEVHPDLAGPSLFVMAVVAFVGAVSATWLHRGQVPVVGPRLWAIGNQADRDRAVEVVTA